MSHVYGCLACSSHCAVECTGVHYGY